MKIIVTKKGEEVYVDDMDYELLKDYVWYSHKGYCTCYLFKRNEGSHIKMHRLIMGNPKGKIVDHIDNNPLNNQRSNLRLVNSSQNAQNRRKNKKGESTSIYKGVGFSKKMNCWISNLIVNYKKYFLGYFKSEIAAAYAYNKKAKEVSEYTLLNEINLPKDELEFILEIDRIEKTKRTAEKQSEQQGVYWHVPLKGQKHGFWEVKIMINGKRRNVGSYHREEDAIRAYRAAEEALKKSKQLTIHFE
jgi:hypothetical protein